ncbi:hypothetical protein C1Y40_05627 [Mycobacterium talmoniae]|uniref:Transport-associated OB type 1 domain-containing protein n=1 Tax=Mycobacterium talmoniae TaxID=1858794 RepID=A0A2S8BC43_9MYCO|nr:hypothetical protein C1Y40_05627 [Mycobacterium talmoniae]
MGPSLARFAQERAVSEPLTRSPVVGQSARNRMVGLVTNVLRDTVMAQVDIQAGPFRLVSLLSREAADELQLEPGSLVVAVGQGHQRRRGVARALDHRGPRRTAARFG